METYEYLLAGGGLSGLTLACAICANPMLSGRILIADRRVKTRNDRTWAFWCDRKSPFNEIVMRKWSNLRFATGDSEQVIGISPYTYNIIRGIDFYEYATESLRNTGRVDFITGEITSIGDDASGASITVAGTTYRGKWLFNSTPISATRKKKRAGLYLQFDGRIIKTRTAAFNTDTVTFLDFRTPQEKGTRFFYVLPYDADRALVEYTCFVTPSELYKKCDDAFDRYIGNVLRVNEYEVIDREGGCLPLRMMPFMQRRTGRHTLQIGNLAGNLKPTTGYSFMRVQADSEAIVRSLVETGRPFRLHRRSAFYSLLDHMMMAVMCRFGEKIGSIFSFLFRLNPIVKIFRFLDEKATLGECYGIMKSLPPEYFYKIIVNEITGKGVDTR